jgi:hypothetical protein
MLERDRLFHASSHDDIDYHLVFLLVLARCLTTIRSVEMYNPDDSDLTFTADQSRLLSEPSLMASESTNSLHYLQATSANEDLSLSDLSIQDRDDIMSRPFSLLSRPDPITSPLQTGEPGEDKPGGIDGDEIQDRETARRQDAKAREEKLQSDLFILKKLNASFAAFNEALAATGSLNDVRLLYQFMG